MITLQRLLVDNGTFSLSPKNALDGYKIALADNTSTNFPGITGISQFFSGTDASNIDVNSTFIKDPSLVQGWYCTCKWKQSSC